MNQVVPYNQTAEEGMSVKTMVGCTLAVGIGVAALIHYGKKFVVNNKAKASDKKSFTVGSPQTIAKQFRMAIENNGKPGINITKLRFLLTRIKSKDEMNKVRDEYFNQYNKQLYTDMKALRDTEYDEMLQIIEGKPEKPGQVVPGATLYKAWAKRIKAAFDIMYGPFTGLDKDALKVALNEIPTQRAFINVGKAYNAEYKADIMKEMKSKLHSWEYPDYMMLITNKPKA